MPKRRGQVWTLDAMLALGTYSLILLFFLASWSGLVTNMRDKFEHEQLHYSAQLVSDNLFSQGLPSAWETATYNISYAPGILSAPGVISPSKLAALVLLNATHYDDVRAALGAGRFQIFLNVSGTHLFGIAPPANSTTYNATTYAVDRLLAMSGNSTLVTLSVWQ